MRPPVDPDQLDIEDYIRAAAAVAEAQVKQEAYRAQREAWAEANGRPYADLVGRRPNR